ncbi:MAG: hypothetical protein R6U00_01375, partial [Prochlorococcaceae cyanobacterium]
MLLLLPGVVAIPAIGVAVSQRHPDELPLDQQLLSLPSPIEPTAADGLAADASLNAPAQVFPLLPADSPSGDQLLASAGRADGRSTLPSPSAPPPVRT